MDIFSVNHLKVEFPTDDKIRPAVDDISFSVEKNKTLAIVGESGSGKTVSCLSAIGLVPGRGKITSGTVLFEGEDILTASSERLRQIHGKDIAVVFQDPTTSLNPVHPVGKQIEEVLRIHKGLTSEEATKETEKLLGRVGISDPSIRLKNFPHQLSGGMNQRVMIAMGIACKPKILIADEPTTALDLTVQAQILRLLNTLKRENDLTLIIITHDFGIVAEIADDVVVMYAGKIVEKAPVFEIFDYPAHPYTKGLIDAMPTYKDTDKKLSMIPGFLPPPNEFFDGCIFAPRCQFSQDICMKSKPDLLPIRKDHETACFFPRNKEGMK